MPNRPRVEIEEELTKLEEIVARKPGGVTQPELEVEFAWKIVRPTSYQTIKRRLAELVRQGRIHTGGPTRPLKYFAVAKTSSTNGPQSSIPLKALGTAPLKSATTAPATASSTIPESATAAASAALLTDESVSIPLSMDGEAIQRQIMKPQEMRKPAGFDTDFLRAYIPGTSWYLPLALGEQMYALGRTPVAGQPAGTYAQEIYEEFLLDLSWSSSRLEGSKLTRIDTKEIQARGRRAGRTNADEIMAWNHKEAIDILVNDAEHIGFNRQTFLSLHAALSHDLMKDSSQEGRLRTRGVVIGGSTYVPLAMPQVIEEMFTLFLEKADAISDPFEQAFFVMVHIPYLQPFADVNKRTSRIGANIPLIKTNLCPLSFDGIPIVAYNQATLGVYEMRRIDMLRDVFAWAYERSCNKYSVLRASKPIPDRVRTTYREELRELIQDIVTRGAWPSSDELDIAIGKLGIPAADEHEVAITVTSIIGDLHEGLLRRYGLRQSQLTTWLEIVEQRRH